MNTLIEYLNSIPIGKRDAFASKCGTSVGYLRKVCSTKQRIGPELCVAIERATNGAVTRRDLRPDDWQDIWPELAIADHPAPQPQEQEAA